MTSFEIPKSIIEHAIDGLENISEDSYKDDLHHYLFNEDYFVIGYYNAEKWIEENYVNTFYAINVVKEYEQQQFGEVTSDFSDSERVANMLAYIEGEQLIYSLDSYNEIEHERLTAKDIENIKAELTEWLNK